MDGLTNGRTNIHTDLRSDSILHDRKFVGVGAICRIPHTLPICLYVCMYVCMCFYGAYNCSGLVRQVSGFSTVSVNAKDTCRNLDSTGLRAEESRVQRRIKRHDYF